MRLLDSPWPSLSHSRGGIMPWALCLSTVGATAGMWNKDHLLLQGQHVYRDGMERDQDSAHPGLSSPWLSIAVLALPLPPLVCQSAHCAIVTSPAFYLNAYLRASFCCGEGTNPLGLCQRLLRQLFFSRPPYISSHTLPSVWDLPPCATAGHQRACPSPSNRSFFLLIPLCLPGEDSPCPSLNRQPLLTLVPPLMV